MKNTRKNPNHCLFHFVFIIVFLGSCTNQSTTNNKHVSEDNHALDTKIDTPLRLIFASAVRSIFEDSKGNYWFGTWDEGVCRYDGRQLTYFTVENGLSHNQVRNIQEDQKGIIWFETGKGISSYDPGTEKVTTNVERVYDSKNDWLSEQDDLWFKSDESVGYNIHEGQHGVYRYDGNDFIYQAFPLPEGGIRDNNSNFAVTSSVVRGKNGVLWFSTYAAAIGFDPSADMTDKKRFTIIDRNAIGLSEDYPHIGIRSIFEDSKGNLWMGANGSGIYRYDVDGTTIFLDKDRLSKIKAKGITSTPFKVFSIGEDSAGNVWFGTAGSGAWKYNPTLDELFNYTTDQGLTSMTIMAFYKNRKGDLLLGMGDGSVCQLNMSNISVGGKSFVRVF